MTENAHEWGDVATLYKALVSAQGELQNPPKTHEMRIPGRERVHRYADIADILSSVRPVLLKHRLCIVQMPSTRDGNLSITTVIAHESGAQIASTLESPGGATPQAIGSAITYLRRYALVSMLGIAAEDDDDGAAASTPAARRSRELPAPDSPNSSYTDAAVANRKTFWDTVKGLIAADKLSPILNKSGMEGHRERAALLCELLGSQSVEPAAMSASEWAAAAKALLVKFPRATETRE